MDFVGLAKAIIEFNTERMKRQSAATGSNDEFDLPRYDGQPPF